MSEKWTVGWRYTPADFFPRPFSQCVAGQLFEVDQGCVKATIDTAHREWSESLPDTLHRVVLWMFQRQQVRNYRSFQVSDYDVVRVAEDGPITRSIYLRDRMATSDDAVVHVASPDGGPVQAVPGPEGSRAEGALLTSVPPDIVEDAVLSVMLDSLGRAIDDQANELVHLYEIRDALSKRFPGKETQPYAVLGISRAAWGELGRLANSCPLRQGRHRGEHAGELRNATPDELEKARSIARDMIDAYIRYLERSSAGEDGSGRAPR